jgi:hypothetical protein
MSITPTFLKKFFSTFTIAIFSISLLFLGFTNLQPKTANAYEINIQTACQNAADNELYYNRGFSNNYHSNQLKSDYCSSAAFRCLFSNCSDGFNADETLNRTCNFTINQGFTNCGNNLICYNSSYSCNNQTIVQPVFTNNYPYNNCQYTNNCYNTCVNCFEQAISQLQNGVDVNFGNANVSGDLLNNITISQRSDIPTSVVSYVNGNRAITEIKNYSGTVLSSTSFSIDERGNTTVNNSNNSSVFPNCERNLNLYICNSFSTVQLANQFGSYGSISTAFRSTFTIAPTQNYSNNNNVVYNYPVYSPYDNYYPASDYYYDCGYIFGCGY